MANLELVTKLAEWGTSDEFTGELDQWMDLRCTIFDRDGNEDGSQPLDWGAAFQEYNTWLDGQLEKFCASVGAGHEEVSMAVGETLEVVHFVAHALCRASFFTITRGDLRHRVVH